MVRIIDLIFFGGIYSYARVQTAGFPTLNIFFKIVVYCNENQTVTFNSSSLWNQGRTVQSKQKTGTGVYSIKFFISKTSVKIVWIQKKKEFNL